jgi:ABC-type phosphate transport system substrate-binding protein
MEKRTMKILRRQWRAPARALLLLLPILATAAPLPAADSFTVIVNAANPVAVLPAAEVSRMFLKRSPHWQNGTRVNAVDLPEDAAARDAFSRAVHGKSASAIKAYWQKMIFSGREVPPPEKATAEVIAFVRGDIGAIAYVPAGTVLGDGVKALKVTP